MCATCGCGDHAHDHFHPHGDHHEPHDHEHAHDSRQARTIRLEQDILAKNDAIARRTRALLTHRNVAAFNFVSSPGSGKTTLLEQTVKHLSRRVSICAIEGDQETDRDAQRLRAAGCTTIQVNTGAGCHLDADMVRGALQRLEPPRDSVLLIENVGNLVCPALFDLGETAKVVVMSVTEGDDKPLKYPHMFRASSLMLINKLDLRPYVDFSVERCVSYARQVNPQIEVLQVSATRGDGIDAWCEWLTAHLRSSAVPRSAV